MLTLLIAVFVLTTVCAIFMLPGVDLQPAALRAFRAAGMFLAFFLFLSLASGCFQITASESVNPIFAGEPSRFLHQPLFDRTCVRLC
jgi:hypothetical protein